MRLQKKVLNSLNKFISIPYSNTDFLIPNNFILGTKPCNFSENNSSKLDWSSLSTINFLSQNIPCIPFDLLARGFEKQTNAMENLESSKLSNVKTAIILKNNSDSKLCEGQEYFAIVTSANCKLEELTENQIVENKGVIYSLFLDLGIESSCFLEGKFAPIINPFVFLTKMKEAL